MKRGGVIPLVALGIAAVIGIGIGACRRQSPRRAGGAAVPPVFTGRPITTCDGPASSITAAEVIEHTSRLPSGNLYAYTITNKSKLHRVVRVRVAIGPGDPLRVSSPANWKVGIAPIVKTEHWNDVTWALAQEAVGGVPAGSNQTGFDLLLPSGPISRMWLYCLTFDDGEASYYLDSSFTP